MSDITIKEVKKELKNFRNNNSFFVCNGCYSIQGKKGKCLVCGCKVTIFEKKEIHTNDVFPKIAKLCVEQGEQIGELTKKLNEAKSLLKEHHQDRLGDYYYDKSYHLFNETVEFIK